MIPHDAFYLYTDASGLIIQAEREGAGSKLLLQIKKAANDPQAATQLFTLNDGLLKNIGDNLVVDYRDGTVMLWTIEPGSTTQQWNISEDGKVTSPGAPGLVMRATRTNMQYNGYNPGAQVYLATDTPYYPDESAYFRRWFRLWTRDRRSIFNLAGSVLGTTPERPQVSDGSAGQLWYPTQGMFVNDAAGGQMLVAANYGGGRPYRIPQLQLPGPYVNNAMIFTEDEAARTIANPSSGTFFVFIPGQTPEGSNQLWPLGQSGMDYRWCYGNGEQWRWEPGEFIDISVGSDGFVCAVTPEYRLVYFNGTSWKPVPGDPAGIVDVAVGSRNVIWAIDVRAGVKRFTNNPSGYWETVQAPPMASLSVALTGTAWGVDYSARIVRYTAGNGNWQVMTPEWQATKGHIDQISTTSEQDVWATSKDGQIWWFDPELGAWESVPGTLERVSTGADGSAWGVTTKSLTYQYIDDATGSWQQEPTLFSRISVGAAHAVWALGPGGVFRYAPRVAPSAAVTSSASSASSASGTPAIDSAERLGSPAPPREFAPDAAEIHEAIFCANMANASYGTDEEVTRTIEEYGYTPFRFFHDPRTGTDAFLAYNDEAREVVLAFRGTSSMQDANIDLWQEMESVPWLGPEVKVVKGFDVAYASVDQDIMNAVRELMLGPDGVLQSTVTFYITGHSLGGGLATISALQLAQLLKIEGRSGLVKLITFAAPAVGNPAFRSYYLSQTRLFAAVAYVAQNDSVATGKWWVAPGVVLDLKAWGYVSPVPSIYYFDDAVPMPECHLMSNYFRQLNQLAERPETPIREIIVEITTGSSSPVPWWTFDSPGTSREVSITLGKPQNQAGGLGGRVNQVLRPAANDWNWERQGSGFESGQRTSFVLNNTKGLVQGDLQELTVSLDISGSYLIDEDSWMLAGVKITANDVVRYDNQQINRLLGPSWDSHYTAPIPPMP